jgi:hypothetical protein
MFEIGNGAAQMNKQQIKTSNMNVRIEVEGRIVPFSLDLENWRWHSSNGQKEADFPLITFMKGKRYELYSDGKFAEVEK